MVGIDIEYLGDLRCMAVHGPSGSELLTDAPADNQGKGELFSPTDLAATSLGTCIATIMGIAARDRNIDIAGMKISVTKEMMNEPVRRIRKISLDFVFPRKLSDREFALLSRVVDHCPVTRSFSPEVEIERSFSFADEA